mgnify:CR=1 FL=1
MLNDFLSGSAAWGVLLTLAAFGLGVLINKRTGKAIFNPLLLGTAFVIVVLSVLNIPYDTYAASASPISCIPNRNSPSPPNRDKTFIIVMVVRFLRACRNAAEFRLCGEKSHTYLLYHTLRLFSTEFYIFIEILGGVQRWKTKSRPERRRMSNSQRMPLGKSTSCAE